jgi:hypothetical protein
MLSVINRYDNDPIGVFCDPPTADWTSRGRPPLERDDTGKDV